MPSSKSPSLEELKADIDAKKEFVSTLPSFEICTDGEAFLAGHLRILGQKEEAYELMLESQRVASVVKSHEELHSPITEECPICLETIQITELDSMAYYLCCGNGTCMTCHDQFMKRRVNSCPLCRADFPPKKKMKNLTMKQAKAGRSWAQDDIGRGYFTGSRGFPVDKREALKWFQLAAEQRHPSALAQLATLHFEGEIVEQSKRKARALMKEAADLGNIQGQLNIGGMCFHGEGGAVDKSKAVHYYTLAYNQGDLDAAYTMGSFFHNGGGGLSNSVYRAKHYLEEAAEGGIEPAYGGLALVLLELCRQQYRGRTYIPGHSSVPRALFWARKSVANGELHAVKMVERIESQVRAKCNNCKRDAECFVEKLKQCKKCKAAWYCGRECQLQHWKKGHKIDCIIKQK